jgi:hypothetical protein
MLRNRRGATGCFTGLIATIGILCCTGVFIGVIFTVVFGALRSSDAYTEAVAIATTDPAVVEALGAPIEPGWFVSGEINVNGNSGTANLTIPLNGSKNDGSLQAAATKQNGVWVFSILQVTVDGQTGSINLLGGR